MWIWRRTTRFFCHVGADNVFPRGGFDSLQGPIPPRPASRRCGGGVDECLCRRLDARAACSGSLKHFYYEDKVHEAVFEAIEDLPPVPLHLTDIFQVEFPLPVAVAAPTSADLSNPYRPCKPGVALPPAHLCTRTPECPYFGCRYKNLIRFAVTPKAPVEEQAVRARATSVVQIKVWDMSDTVFRPRLQESDSRSYLNTNRVRARVARNAHCD